MTATWAVLPAAGSGSRFGGDVPKQYLEIAGRSLLAHSLDALLVHPGVDGAIVALAADDSRWPGWTSHRGKPVRTCIGGLDRAASVLAALDALALDLPEQTLVLVHDAARPCLQTGDVDRLLQMARGCPDGALLAAPVRDTLKRIDDEGRSAGTAPRERLWRAFTPQAAPLGVLRDALRRAKEAGVAVTDEAMALEYIGLRPRLVEGRDDNLKVTTAADRALAEFVLARRACAASTESQ